MNGTRPERRETGPATGALLAALSLLTSCSLLLTPSTATPPADDADLEDSGRDGSADGDMDADADADADSSYCGDGIVDDDESCDHDSDFCNSECEWTTPAGWIRCDDADGASWFYSERSVSGIPITWEEGKRQCLSIVDEFDIDEYRYAGLAVADENELWECLVLGLELDLTKEYFIGVQQDDEGTESDGGWHWVADNGVRQVDVANYDDSHPLWTNGNLDDVFDGVHNCDCLRVSYSDSSWGGHDLLCGSSVGLDIICMVTF